MNLWELRQLIESHTPVWALLIVPVLAVVYVILSRRYFK